ncbi:MAG: S8/S53 family peptidase [Parachlamydiaceae bacterium]|nr:S8/S53 family peptidase [Parachlamydiaceae bacterium]
MKDYSKVFYRLFILLVLSIHMHISANSSETTVMSYVRLSDHVPHKATADAALLGRLETSTEIPVTFVLPLRNQNALETLLQRLYDPADQEYYGKYLTPEEFNEQFAPTQADYDKVIAYAKSLNLEIVGTHSNRTLLNVSAPSTLLEKAFNVQIDQYQSLHGRTFYAPTNDPAVPNSIATIISGIVGLDNHAVWRPHHYLKEVTTKSTESEKVTTPSLLAPSGPNGGLSPRDITTAYNLSGVSANGTGQLSGYQLSDINTYSQQFGLPQAVLTDIIVDGGPAAGIDAEVTLDIELVHALAPQAQIYVYKGPNSSQGVLDTYNRIATDNIAKQVSTSWGLGEDFKANTTQLQAENAIFQQMAAHGQTMYAASGDDGAFDDYRVNGSQSIAVDDPASQPYVVGVGGTKLTVDSQSGAYITESVWNGGLGAAGGGGVSKVWPIPVWQQNVSTTYSKTNRNVPDVSLNSDGATGYAIFHNGQWGVYGGTSCAAPLWAGFTARVNQTLVANNKQPLGFANPALYTIGTGPNHALNFHDINTGDNLFYHAGTGYDNATGWGSFNGANLLATLTNSLPTPPPAQNLPHINIVMNHAQNQFFKGSIGTYFIDINNDGKAPTAGPITVRINLPQGLRYRFLRGLGWTVNGSTLTCTQNFPIKAGFAYPTIILYVDVATNALSLLTTTATVSGGGSVSSTVSNQTAIR